MVFAIWVCAFACGIAVAILSAAYVAAGFGLVALGLLAWSLSRRTWVTAVAAGALAAGAGLGIRAVRECEAPSWAVPEDTLVRLSGQVVMGPEAGAGQGESKKIRFLLAVHSLDGSPLNVSAVVTVTEGVPDLAPGDEVAFSARLFLPRGFANPGLPDARLLSKAQGVDLLASVRSAADIQIVSGLEGSGWPPRRLAFRLRSAMARVIDQRLAGPAAAFVRTMVLGERTEVSPEVEEGFRAAGATHVLSVSGLHLAVVAALVFGLLRRLALLVPQWALRMNATALAAALSLPAVALYTLLTGEAMATLRSAFMAVVALGAMLVNRPFSLAASIAFAALVLLVQSPLALLDVSFQLSFASVIALGFFAQRFSPAAPPRGARWWRRALGWLGRCLAASSVASLSTMPLVAHHFGEVTPVAPVGNLVLVPLVELAVLPCGLVGALLALAHPVLGAAPLWIAGVASQAALYGAEGFRRLAPIILVRYPNLLESAALVASAGLLLYGLSRGTGRRLRWLLSALLAGSLAAGSLVVRDLRRKTADEMRVTFIDVGQGDSALLEGPGGFVMLVDGGGRYDDSFDTGARVVEPVLRARGIGRVDLVVLSHPHPDHLNGLLRVLARFEVGTLWTSGDDGHNPKYRELLALAHQRGVATPVPAGFDKEGVRVEPLGPWVGDVIGPPPGLDANNASLVVRASYAGHAVLFTGDIGEDGEAELVARGETGLAIASDVLKVPHHGSRMSSGDEFLAAVQPSTAVVSVGKHNTFHLPSAATLARYRARNTGVHRTDLEGAVTVAVNAQGRLSVTCVRGCR
jgi:competence protein ComEC